MNEKILHSIDEHYIENHSAVGQFDYAVIIRRGRMNVGSYYPPTMTPSTKTYYFYVCAQCGEIIPIIEEERP